MPDLIGKIRRGLRKPPRVVFARIGAMARTQIERLRLPRRNSMTEAQLLHELQAQSLDVLWRRLGNRPFPAWFGPCNAAQVDALCGSSVCSMLLTRVDDALAHRVDLLGSGVKELGRQIDWHTDFKTGFSWEPSYFSDIDYNNPERPSDVKMPWELSRLQWLIPAGQAFLLSGDGRYATAVRGVLEQWIEANPCGYSVNWACTMEAALRIFSWTWFFHVFHQTPSWQDPNFRFRFLRALYLHVEFTDHHIERSDVNGNHYTADAAGLVLGGLFFGEGSKPQHWQREGWRILCEEFPRQVFPDGVDFEASVPYHRLVAELFLWPAMYRTMHDLPVSSDYRNRLAAMARFTRAYSRPDGSVPLWGDADDARALPFGTQDINDHRYLPTLIGLYLNDPDLCHHAATTVDEIFWVTGPVPVRRWMASLPAEPTSQSFPDGGFYVMRHERDHIFIDCGPVGLAGRGGHGHNDCLSFEAVLDGVPLVSDCGAYVYTASYAERNAFRSTAYHNTPQIDDEEINRFVRSDYLWNLHYDAIPRPITWEVTCDHALFIGEHSGYRRLTSPVTPRRTIRLDFDTHVLFIQDEFKGDGFHDVCIPLHLAHDVNAVRGRKCEWILNVRDRYFYIWWPEDSGYTIDIESARISPSYGVTRNSSRLVWRRKSQRLQKLKFLIAPAEARKSFELERIDWIFERREIASMECM